MPKDSNNACQEQPEKPVFQPFSYVNKRTPETYFTEHARNVAGGVSIILHLLLKDLMRRESGEAPLLGDQENADLMLLGIASSELVCAAADKRIEGFNDQTRCEVDGHD
jgi:hypothetical protein